jgi:hypothetical protein
MGRMPHVYLIRHGKSLSVSTTGYCIRLLTYVATDYFLLVKIGQTEWSVNGKLVISCVSTRISTENRSVRLS